MAITEAKAVLSHFFELPTKPKLYQIGQGHINDSYKAELTLAEGRKRAVLLQRINTHVFIQPAAVMENIEMVACHLHSTPYPLDILRPIRTQAGELYHRQSAGSCWRVFPFFENAEAPDHVTTSGQAWQAAWAFGNFALHLSGLPVGNLHCAIPHFHDGKFRLAELRKALRHAAAERRQNAKDCMAGLTLHLDVLNKMAKQNLPLRIAHHDAKIANVLFDKTSGKACAVVDLDTVMPGTLLSDFGDLVRSGATNVAEGEGDTTRIAVLPDRYAALEAGYLDATGDILWESERNLLSDAGPWLTLMQAVRFLTDYLGGDVYYKVDYAAQNLERAFNQLALFKALREHLEGRLIVC